MITKLVDIPTQTITCHNLVGGEWRLSTGPSVEIRSPYNGLVIGRVPVTTPSEVDEALDVAQASFVNWRKTPIKERCQLLFRLRHLILEEIETLANRAASEAGKTVDEGRAGIQKGVEVLEYAISLQNLAAQGGMEVSRGVTCQMTREPLGVVVGITPFNFPAMVPLWMYPIALALGNVFVLKPSEKVSLTSQLIGELIKKAGFPAGVFTIINGDKTTAESLIDHPVTKAVAFVGSTPAAKAVYERATGKDKRALTLGGAKNQLILVPDANLDLAVRGIVDSFTGCAGQRCMAASLLIAVGDTEHFIKRVIEQARALPLGTGMGAIIDKAALARMSGIIERAAKERAQIVLDGRHPKVPTGYEDGIWLAPTIIDHARPEMECATTEIFGPILTIIRVKTLAEALEIENKNIFGNATSVFTQSGDVAKLVSDESTSGMIGINIGVPVPREPFSFGGTKESKFGTCDITGDSSIEFWTTLKKVTTKWAKQKDQNWMS
jgi:malonate-semialdehyde dehydrogenase (acetylating)/methylmalonate-semialdehyde dehydrogenase